MQPFSAHMHLTSVGSKRNDNSHLISRFFYEKFEPFQTITANKGLTRLKVNFSADREHARLRGPRSPMCFDINFENGEIRNNSCKSSPTTTYRLLGPWSAIACSRSKRILKI